jgi:hypothetical protein
MKPAADMIRLFLRPFKRGLHLWPLSLFISAAWYCLFVIVWLTNQYGVYSPRGLVKFLFLLPLFSLAAGWLTGWLLPGLEKEPKTQWARLLLASAATALILLAMAPLPVPAVRHTHHLQIISDGARNPASQGAVVEIRQVRALDESPIPWQAFKLSGDWQINGDRLVSEGGQPGSVAELEAQVPVGLVLSLRYNDNAGMVRLDWDGKSREYDLYAARGITAEAVLNGYTSGRPSLARIAYPALSTLILYAALTSLLTVFGLAFELKMLSRPLSFLLLAGLYLAFFSAYLQLKQSYATFSEERAFLDTDMYARTAEAPLASVQFWAGEAPLTLPLAYKLLGINSQNDTNTANPAALSRVSHFQTWLSILCWTLLGLAFSARLRTPWLRPFAFGLVVFFSLNLEISLWDSLLLSESVSISLFALTLGAWLAWELIPERWFTPVAGVLSLLVIAGISGLYSFTRDSNPYFLAAGAGILILALLVRRVRSHLRGVTAAYIVVLAALFGLQNLSFNLGNRWQIHIYDHLARRILQNESARDYFANAGLPVTPALMKIVDMGGHKYQNYLRSAPKMQAVREWVEQKGRATMIGFLISHPGALFWDPLQHVPALLNGSNLEYHNPRYAVQTIPRRLADLTQKIYPRSPIALWLFLGVILAGLAWALIRRPEQTAWLVVGILLLSLYPLMVIVWNGNPLEIERHAAQLGIQLRLAGWMAVGLLLDHLV